MNMEQSVNFLKNKVSNLTIKQYNSEYHEQWNAFVGKAKNATFLFHRDFMEYHSDRFEDYSLMVFENEKLLAVLPANRVGNEVFSHQGLTYGGLVYSDKIKLAAIIDIFRNILLFLNQNEIKRIQVKTIPSIYHQSFSQELEYALFLADAKLIRRDCLSVIDLTKPFHISRTRKEGNRRAEKHGLTIREELNFELFWNEILILNLVKKHGAKPVHTAAEITLLQSKFPESIRQFNVYQGDKIVAGTTIFETSNVAHSQYISGNEDKNKNGALDFLHFHLLNQVFKNKHYFDFGISNEQQGKKLNEGLTFWKQGFGASTVVQDFYEVDTANYSRLENVLI